jgi:hypothetical protein
MRDDRVRSATRSRSCIELFQLAFPPPKRLAAAAAAIVLCSSFATPANSPAAAKGARPSGLILYARGGTAPRSLQCCKSTSVSQRRSQAAMSCLGALPERGVTVPFWRDGLHNRVGCTEFGFLVRRGRGIETSASGFHRLPCRPRATSRRSSRRQRLFDRRIWYRNSWGSPNSTTCQLMTPGWCLGVSYQQKYRLAECAIGLIIGHLASSMGIMIPFAAHQAGSKSRVRCLQCRQLCICYCRLRGVIGFPDIG